MIAPVNILYPSYYDSVYLLVEGSGIRFTSRYQEKTITGLVGSSVNFSWTFSGDVRTVTWGLKKESVTNSFDTNGKLVSLNEASIMLPLSIPLSYNGRVSGGRTFNSSSGKAIFTLNNVMKDDEKFYLCEIYPNDPKDSPRYDFVYLAIEESPIITHLTAVNKSYNEGGRVSISCEATGTPDPDVKWIHNGQVKSSGANKAHLIFMSISRVDVGMYTCRASNSAGSKEKKVQLAVN